MDDSTRSEVDYAQLELLLQQHLYDEALPVLSELLEDNPSDHQARLCRLLVIRILILRHLLAAKTIPSSPRSRAIALRAPTFPALRATSGFRLLARLRNSVYSLPVRLNKHRLAVAARLPWPGDVQYWSRLQLITRLRDRIGPFLGRVGRYRAAVAAAVPPTLAILLSVYVLAVWPVENQPRLAPRSAAPHSDSPAKVNVAKPQPVAEAFNKSRVLASANLTFEPSSFHQILTRLDDANPPYLGNGAPSSSAAQNIAPGTGVALTRADKKQGTGSAKLNPAVGKAVVKQLPTRALKRPHHERENPVSRAPKIILARYQTTQGIPIRKSARFGAPTLRKITRGTSVDVIEINHSWAKVSVKTDANEDVTGFVRIEFLAPDAVGSL
jgi:hypothetical protein